MKPGTGHKPAFYAALFGFSLYHLFLNLLMKTLKFLTQIEYDPERTKFITDPPSLCGTLEYFARASVDSCTVGACPEVTVIAEELPATLQEVQLGFPN